MNLKQCVVFLSFLAACGESPRQTPGGGRDGGTSAADSGMTTADTGTALDGAANEDASIEDSAIADGGANDSGSNDTGVAPDSGLPGDPTYMLRPGDCFFFATGTSTDSHSMSCGDMLALSGFNVDLSSDFGPDGEGGFCHLQGRYTSLAAVPTNFANCNWSTYIEGLDPLDDHGVIVRDAAQVHHYRMRIVSNAQPALIFSYSQID